MKNILALSFLFSLLVFTACKERNSGIDYTVPPVGQLMLDSQYSASGVPATFTKVQLIEDFSGVSCPNCPAAAKIIDGIDTTNPGRVVDIVMHSNLDGKLSDTLIVRDENNNSIILGASKSTYRNTASDILRNILGPKSTQNLPKISLNRKFFEGDEIVFLKEKLQSNITAELTQSSPANITFKSHVYDPATHILKAVVMVQYGSAISDSDYISVALKEDKIKDWQEKSGSGGLNVFDSNYIHNAVLRKYVYPQSGILLPNPTAGKTFEISFNTTIPAEWNPDNMEIVAILHKQNSAKGNNGYYVSQVGEVKVK